MPGFSQPLLHPSVHRMVGDDVSDKSTQVQNILYSLTVSSRRKTDTSLTRGRWPTLPVVSRVGKKHSVVIPKAVRERVPVREGEAVVWSVERDRIVLKPTSFKRLAGSVKASTLTNVE